MDINKMVIFIFQIIRMRKFKFGKLILVARSQSLAVDSFGISHLLLVWWRFKRRSRNEQTTGCENDWSLKSFQCSGWNRTINSTWVIKGD